jgi:hypothetical protein
MNTPLHTPRPFIRQIAVTVLCALAPAAFGSTALAQNHASGGRAFSGGHMSAPSHMSAPAGHASVGYAAAPHFTPHANFAAGGYAGGAMHYAPNANFATGRNVPVNSYAGHASANRVVPHFAPDRGGYAPDRGGYRGAPGRYVPGAGFRYGHWRGGYWHGGFWPRVYWGSGFAWFLPVLPVYCATYWWNSIPYYYYNDVYYTYDPAASGYVVTTPPPAQESSDYDASAASAPDPGYAGSDGSPPAAASAPSSGSMLFAYPKNGQSEEQQSEDRQECARWASGQTASDGTGTSMDYQRAMTACLQGRGYSVD